MEVLRTAILEMCRQRKEEDFCPSQVVKTMFPEDWEQFLEEVISVAIEMNRAGLILITQNGLAVETDFFPTGPFKIRSRIPN